MPRVEAGEMRKLVALEDRHWWYAERRHLIARLVRPLSPGLALDLGAAGGGNTRVLRDLAWQAVALEYAADGVRAARERGVPTLRADAGSLPLADTSFDLVVAFDVLEHLQDDDAAVAEVRRVLRPGGTFLVAVPADMRLWSAHDEAVGHVRRYDRAGLLRVLERGGFGVASMRSWNVLLRPVVRVRRRSTEGSDLQPVPGLLNAALRSVVSAERHLPLGNLPGVSLVAVATAR